MSRGTSYIVPAGPTAWNQILIRDLHPQDHNYEVVWNGASGALLAGQAPQQTAAAPPERTTMDITGVNGKHYRRPVHDVITMLEKLFAKHGPMTLVEACRRTGLAAGAFNHALLKGRGRICKVASRKRVAIYGLAEGGAQ